MKIWRHKGTLKPTTTRKHTAKPYARIGTDRCIICGDEIELIIDEPTKVENPYRTRPVRYILNKYLKRKKKTYSLEEILAELQENQTDGRIEMELNVIVKTDWPKQAPENMRELARKLMYKLKNP